MKTIFRQIASRSAQLMGSHAAFLGGIVIVLAWLVTGPLFRYSNTWQLVINTATSVVTFLMVFLIQSTQGRDTRAIQLKLDELLRAIRAARNELVSLENLSDDELDKLREEFAALAAKSQKSLAQEE